MSIHVALHHRSCYTYDRPATHFPHIVRLRPAPHCRTPILSYSQRILPAKHFINWQQDPFSNYQARLVFPEPTSEFLVEVDLIAEMSVYNPFDFFLEESAMQYPFSYGPEVRQELAPFLETAETGSPFRDYLSQFSGQKTGTVEFLTQLNQKLWKDIKYLVRLEPGVQTADETLKLQSGSCRDSGWLLVQILRHLGLAARFVSGYLIQLRPDVKSLDGPSGAENDFTDLHAWAEVYLPGAGWIGLDPTSGLLAGEGHLPLACTPAPSSAAPISGATEKCEAEFTHKMRVTRIYESPRVTKPYTEEQWQAIDALGRHVDAELQTHDVRLTMGGEPTFVSLDNRDGSEWNVSALGPEKRILAGKLLHRLKNHFAPGGLKHYGQGKWYPGESLPRWALACYWRKDGEPIWRNGELIADEAIDYGHSDKEAKLFTEKLAQVLGLKAKHILPAYEDIWYYLWREKRLPANVDPLESKLENHEERDRLARIFQQGLNKIVGYALPLQRSSKGAGPHWNSGPWFLRTEHLFLVPGDSPMGFRLPLDSIPWVVKGDYPYIIPPDPMDRLSTMPAWNETSLRYQSQLNRAQPFIHESATGHPDAADDMADRPPRQQESADWIIRTALCVEPRNGRLHIFMPPVSTTEDYLDLVAAVETTATQLQLPVILEGTPPPTDSRLNSIKVTPDPGVIEVNLHPSHSWAELVRNTTILYDEAYQIRLTTEKFLIDGRHVGTGGGNHIVVGGPTPSDSPILRRPDLLRSLLCYWQNHPALSFLFSGLFIGPTSQHPRVDEARNDALYELEIAFDQVPHGREVPPWLVDRIFRNLLCDTTGNTHRTEFAIDKLYSPDSSAGRLGLLELRAFEMPPHNQMSLAQQLLLRGLIARFWKEPYRQPLVHWGTDLHDRFMLPHFVQHDFNDVINDLKESGYHFEEAWYAPHFEFRFPLYGAITKNGVHLELRQALEPWHVLGEEGTAGGTVRYVDSSLERLQVKVTGLTDTRHAVLCNGQTVPLQPTGTNGEYVAGVRFRAWQPPECLHPTIGVHSPLVFEIVDKWNERSLGGCTYHVAHPGGRNYCTLPINAYEAESRRLARFFKMGHSSSRVVPTSSIQNPRFPFTLDLRCT